MSALSKIITVCLIIFITFSLSLLFYKFFIRENETVIKLGYALGINGKVSGFNRARGYKVYLKGTSMVLSLDSFVNFKILENQGLGYYIDYEDSIVKMPSSDSLILLRDGKATVWKLNR